MAAAPVVVPKLADIDHTKFIFSDLKKVPYDFVDPKTGKKMSGVRKFVEVYYETPGRKLAFSIDNCKTASGIQSGSNAKKGFMSLNLTEEQVKLLREKVDKPLYSLTWHHRASLFPGGAEMTEQIEMKALYKGIVKAGAEMKDKPGQFWPKTLTGDVPMRKTKQQTSINSDECDLVDPSGNEYSWTATGNCNILEAVVEVTDLVFEPKILCHQTFRLIVPDKKAPTKYATERTLELKHKGAIAHATATASEEGKSD